MSLCLNHICWYNMLSVTLQLFYKASPEVKTENQYVSLLSDKLYKRILVDAFGENIKWRSVVNRSDHPATQVPILPSQVFSLDTEFYWNWVYTKKPHQATIQQKKQENTAKNVQFHVFCSWPFPFLLCSLLHISDSWKKPKLIQTPLDQPSYNEVQNHSRLILRPHLWPYGMHQSSCTIITSKQTTEESILTKGHLSYCHAGVGFITKAAQSQRQPQMATHHILLL